MVKTLELDWDADSIKHAFLIGDAPCHNKKYHDSVEDEFPTGDPDGNDVVDLTKKFDAKGIGLTVIMLDNIVEKMTRFMADNHSNFSVFDFEELSKDKSDE